MATTPGFSMVEIARLEIAFLKSFELFEGSPVEGQSVQQNDTKMRKKKERLKRKQIKYQKAFWKLWFLRMPGIKFLKRHACGKKGMLSCCKCLLKLNLVHVQAENLQKKSFLAKRSVSQWVKSSFVNG